jgi:hypothetical protein
MPHHHPVNKKKKRKKRKRERERRREEHRHRREKAGRKRYNVSLFCLGCLMLVKNI